MWLSSKNSQNLRKFFNNFKGLDKHLINNSYTLIWNPVLEDIWSCDPGKRNYEFVGKTTVKENIFDFMSFKVVPLVTKTIELISKALQGEFIGSPWMRRKDSASPVPLPAQFSIGCIVKCFVYEKMGSKICTVYFLNDQGRSDLNLRVHPAATILEMERLFYGVL